MGGYGTSIPLKKAPRDGRELVEKVWDRVGDHIVQRLVLSDVGLQIIQSYASMEASDGISEGNWSANGERIYVSFGDGGGNCTYEMNALVHWFELAVIDKWDELTAIVASAGGVIGKAPRTLEEALSQKTRTLLYDGSKGPAYVYDDRVFWAGGKSNLIADLPPEEQAKIKKIMTDGICMCEACDVLRIRTADRKAAAAPKPKKKLAPKSKKKVAAKPKKKSAATPKPKPKPAAKTKKKTR